MEIIKIISIGLFLIICTYMDIKSKEISIISCGFWSLSGLVMNMYLYDTGILFILLGMLPALIILIFSLITKGGIGIGDVMVISAMGLNLGLVNSVFVLTIALMVCGLYGLVLICLRIKKYKDKIPFVPFIAIGYIWIIFMEGIN